MKQSSTGRQNISGLVLLLLYFSFSFGGDRTSAPARRLGRSASLHSREILCDHLRMDDPIARL